jgi:hypothetical protein
MPWAFKWEAACIPAIPAPTITIGFITCLISNKLKKG